MDMQYYKKYEPLFGAWHITRVIGEGSYGTVFEIEREDFGVTYKAALKAITIPKNKSDLQNAMSEGMDEKNVSTYFRGFVEELTREIALMDRLKGNSYVINYDDHVVIEHEDEIAWDILIRMELLTPLNRYLQEQGQRISEEEVIRIGIDISRALELCAKNRIIHRDVKPENIFYSKLGSYKLGDFGIARIAEKTSGASTRVGTGSYMAPEVYRGETYGATVDVYSLGLVLYRLINNGRLPFLPQPPDPITHSQREQAQSQRLSGVPLPQPANAGAAFAQVILKAAAFRPEDRYQSPAELRRALEELQAGASKAEEGAQALPEQKGEGGEKTVFSGMAAGALQDAFEDGEEKTASVWDVAPEEEAQPAMEYHTSRLAKKKQPEERQKQDAEQQSGGEDAQKDGGKKSRLLLLAGLGLVAIVLIVMLATGVFGDGGATPAGSAASAGASSGASSGAEDSTDTATGGAASVTEAGASSAAEEGSIAFTYRAYSGTEVYASAVGNAYVRKAAGTQNDIVSSLLAGDRVRVLGETTDAAGGLWYHIRYEYSTEGYVRADYLTLEEGTPNGVKVYTSFMMRYGTVQPVFFQTENGELIRDDDALSVTSLDESLMTVEYYKGKGYYLRAADSGTEDADAIFRISYRGTEREVRMRIVNALYDENVLMLCDEYGEFAEGEGYYAYASDGSSLYIYLAESLLSADGERKIWLTSKTYDAESTTLHLYSPLVTQDLDFGYKLEDVSEDAGMTSLWEVTLQGKPETGGTMVFLLGDKNGTEAYACIILTIEVP